MVDERKAAIERVSNFSCGHPLLETVTNAIKLAEVVINGPKAVMSFEGNLIWRFALGIAFPTDDAFVGQSGADVVQSRTAWDDFLMMTLVGGNQC